MAVGGSEMDQAQFIARMLISGRQGVLVERVARRLRPKGSWLKQSETDLVGRRQIVPRRTSSKSAVYSIVQQFFAMAESHVSPEETAALWRVASLVVAWPAVSLRGTDCGVFERTQKRAPCGTSNDEVALEIGLFPCPSCADLDWGNFAPRRGKGLGLMAKTEGRAEGKIKGPARGRSQGSCLHMGLYGTREDTPRAAQPRRAASLLAMRRAVFDWLRCGTSQDEATKRPHREFFGCQMATPRGKRTALSNRYARLLPTRAGNYQVWLQFNDGRKGLVDLADELYGAIFEPLRDRERFAQLVSRLRARGDCVGGRCRFRVRIP